MNIKIGKAKTELLLHMNGTNGSQSFLDSSKNNFSIITHGNAQISTVQSKFGGASGFFDGTGDYLSGSMAPIYSSDFTIEGWVYRTNSNALSTIFEAGNIQVGVGGIHIYIDGNGTFNFNNGITEAISGGTAPLNQWVHFAAVRNGTTNTLYVNGVSVGTSSQTFPVANSIFSIGGAPNYGFYFQGYIDEFRITKNFARYTSNFTLPSSEFPTETSLTITKGGSSKLNQKKYIDLLSPFISSITLSGGSYSDGNYFRNSGGATTFNGPGGKIIVLAESTWQAYDPSYAGGVEPAYTSSDLISWLGDQPIFTTPTSILTNSLAFLFDPIFYSDIAPEDVNNSFNKFVSSNPATIDIGNFEMLRSFQYKDLVPSKYSVTSHQEIRGFPRTTKKVAFKNNTFSYIKYLSDVDVQTDNNSIFFPRNWSDLKRPLLTMRKPNGSNIFSSNERTLLFFVRLQRPASHKVNGRVHRSKKGFFFHFCYGGSADQGSPMFNIGYRSPHYLRDNIIKDRFNFEPFSFVINFGCRGQENPTFMTDFKFKFGEMYCLAISESQIDNSLKFYVNGELQTMARLNYNPIAKPRSGYRQGKALRRNYKARKLGAPMGPGFEKIDGSIFTNTSDSWGFTGFDNRTCIIFGKSNMGHFWDPGAKRSKKYLNNLDVGVTIAYNLALSQENIKQIYETYRYRYV